MNKYLSRGLILISLGIITIAYSLNLMEAEKNLYKIIMTLGVVLFGIGVVVAMYSLFRKIDRRTLEKIRREQQNNKQ